MQKNAKWASRKNVGAQGFCVNGITDTKIMEENPTVYCVCQEVAGLSKTAHTLEIFLKKADLKELFAFGQTQ